MERKSKFLLKRQPLGAVGGLPVIKTAFLRLILPTGFIDTRGWTEPRTGEVGQAAPGKGTSRSQERVRADAEPLPSHRPGMHSALKSTEPSKRVGVHSKHSKQSPEEEEE